MDTTKKRVTVQIAGNTLSLVTDEPAEYVTNLAGQLDKKLSALTKNNFRISVLDAALLCALDASGEKLTADARIRTLEAQIALYEKELAALREQLSSSADTPAPADAVSPETAAISAQIRASEEGSSPEDKIRALEKYLENKKPVSSKAEAARVREEKIRYIESLLRGGSDNT